jgi:hypothetical protein
VHAVAGTDRWILPWTPPGCQWRPLGPWSSRCEGAWRPPPGRPDFAGHLQSRRVP